MKNKAKQRRGAAATAQTTSTETSPNVAVAAPSAEVEEMDYYQGLDEFVRAHVPSGSRVLVVSKGDDLLLKLNDRQAGHFPQADDGTYSGYYPSDSGEAIAGLEELRERGAQHLFFPCTSAWWLEHYEQFAEYLRQRYPRVAEEDDKGIIYDLRKPLKSRCLQEPEPQSLTGTLGAERAKWEDYYASLPFADEDEATKGFNQEWVKHVSQILSPGSTTLEAGCGAGWQSLALARTGSFQVCLMDFTRAALAYARRLFNREGLRGDFLEGDSFQPGEPQFDLVFNAGVLEHYTFEKQVELVRAMASRSRRYVAVLVPNRLCYWYWVWRIQKAGAGQWPFGKEMPLMDLSSVFTSAGLRFLGQTFMGQTWTEGLIRCCEGLGPSLRNLVLEVHRSPVIPLANKAYLVAALGSVSAEHQQATCLWGMPPLEAVPSQAETTAALADALALRIAAEGKLQQLTSKLENQTRMVEQHAAECRRRDAEITELQVQVEHQIRLAEEVASDTRTKVSEISELRGQLTEKTARASRAVNQVVRSRARIRQLQARLEEAEARAAQASQEKLQQRSQVEGLRRRAAETEAQLDASRRRQEWLESALATERRARQVLEGAVSGNYPDTVARIRDVVRSTIPREAIVLVVSKGDPALTDLDGRQAWHFPRGEDGGYAGHYPADSSAAIEHLQALITKGGQFLLLPSTALWWLEHYRGFQEYLDRSHVRVWRDERCVIYSLSQKALHETGPSHAVGAKTSLAAVKSGPAQPEQETHGGRSSETAGATLANLHDVVCFPIINWDFRFQRPQQLMCRFAAAGHRVFYLSHEFRTCGEPFVARQLASNIYEVSLRGPRINAYQGVLYDDARDAIFASLDALRREYSLGATAAIIQLPFWWPVVKQAASAFAWPVVYDCMDHHAGFSTNHALMVDQERELLSQANLVVASSASLETEARKYNQNVLLVRNACEFEHFAKIGSKPRGPRPVIGYFGAIADWFDSDLVADLAERRPDWDFVLVGSTFSADVSRLSNLPNVLLPGEKPYAEIPDWLGKFDVTVLPFKRTPLTEATNPVKAYEIFAAGKPLISVPLPEMLLLGSLVRLASTVDEFEREIDDELNERDPSLESKRRFFAQSNTWQARFEVFSRAVRNSFPKASIVIATFNNLELNRSCLDSLYAHTEWPNYEVVVVDNGSTDATAEYLKRVSLTHQNLRLILNQQNEGFARANNQGLSQATGEYLVLLNNDTVVPRAWLSKLIRHLAADPTIGLIGPVTNEIGNEAKVAVGYEKLSGMAEWAAQFTRENDGRLFPLRVLAMFCTVMRREVFEEIGPLDERYEIGMFEDDDYSRRIRERGYKLLCARDAFVHHAGQASFKLLGTDQYRTIFEKNRCLYEQHWGEMWEPHLDEKDRRRIPKLQSRLREVVTQSNVDASRVVVMLPSVGWNISLVQRPHHLARELARQGFLVLFDCAGSLVDHFADFLPVERNLWLYKGPAGVLDVLPQPILWTLPYNVPLVDRWSKRTIIYDWIDDLSVFPYRQDRLVRNHERMLSEADTVLYVARSLVDKLHGRRRDALYVPNAVDYERFASPSGEAVLDDRFRAMIATGRPMAGYYGAIASWLDVELLARTADTRPDWNFVLIGQKLPDAPSLVALEGRANFLVLPAQKYEILPHYLAAWTVALIPFRVNEITASTSPLKLYEYFAAGKPVLSTPMPECEAYPEVQIILSVGEFADALDVARTKSRDSSFRKRLQALGRANTWRSRVEEVAKHLGQNHSQAKR